MGEGSEWRCWADARKGNKGGREWKGEDELRQGKGIEGERNAGMMEGKARKGNEEV